MIIQKTPLMNNPLAPNDTSTAQRSEHTTTGNISTTIYSQHLPRTTTQSIQHTSQKIRNRQNPSITPGQRLQLAQNEWAKIFQTRPLNEIHNGHRPILLTQHNQKQNTPWGDKLQEKENNTTRVYSLNLNGISLDRRGGQFEDLCKIAKEIQADIICCQEHNVDTSKPVVRSILYDTMRHHWQRFRLHTGATAQEFTHWYKPGGTLMFSIENITGRIVDQQKDSMGRWVSQTLKGQNSRQVTIISAYQPVTDSITSGLMTVAAQQRSLLIKSRDTMTEPRKAFKRDLRLLLQQLKDKKNEIYLTCCRDAHGKKKHSTHTGGHYTGEWSSHHH
jgi:exonuclease III